MNHDHSKVEVDEVGNVTAMVDSKGNVVDRQQWYRATVKWADIRCPAYERYVYRRNAVPSEEPRMSARWASDSTQPVAKCWDHEPILDSMGKRLDEQVRKIEAAQDEYPPVYDRPTFFLCVLIAALAGMLVGIIAGAMVMA